MPEDTGRTDVPAFGAGDPLLDLIDTTAFIQDRMLHGQQPAGHIILYQ